MSTEILFVSLVVLNVLLVALIATRHERELDAARRALADAESGITQQQRADAVAYASQAALENQRRARELGDEERRRLWLSVQAACSDEIQDVALAIKAGVP